MGLEELTNISNVERLKKELRVRLRVFGDYSAQQPLGQPAPWIPGMAPFSDPGARPTHKGHFFEGQAADLGASLLPLPGLLPPH